MVKEFMPRLIEGTLPAPEEVREYMLKQVHNYFNDHEKVGRPEVFGRIGDERVVTFDLLRPEVIRTITRKFLAGLITSAQKLGHTLVVDSSVESFMAKEMVKPNRLLQGGRGIKTLLRGKVENPLTDWIARPSRPSQMRLEVAITDDGKELIVNGDRVGTE
jgi:ATP-dependent Clp protease ATP-binding subunit ClpA